MRMIAMLALLPVLLSPALACAQQFPARPVRIIIGIAPGSPTDAVTRSAAAELARSLGQPVTVENRPGGDMVIATEACARAAPDGHTWCVVSNSAVSINPHIFTRLSYDPDRDLKPVTALFFLTQGMIVNAALPVGSVAELKALALARPGALNLGTLGTGGADLHRLWLNDEWKTDIVGVPYKGANLVMLAMVAGEIQMSLSNVGGLGPHLKSGKMRLLAVGSSKRLRQFPDVPTYNESGLEGFPRTWWGLFTAAGAPDAAVRRINAEFARLYAEPKFAAYLEGEFLEPAISSPEKFAVMLKDERERAGQMVRKYNIPRQ
jgi:tripartite-type tricarboxylate transporter receptor subunit TctC